MTRQINNLIRGAVSVFDLLPAPDKRHRRHRKRNGYGSVRSDWAAVRTSLKDAGIRMRVELIKRDRREAV